MCARDLNRLNIRCIFLKFISEKYNLITNLSILLVYLILMASLATRNMRKCRLTLRCEHPNVQNCWGYYTDYEKWELMHNTDRGL